MLAAIIYFGLLKTFKNTAEILFNFIQQDFFCRGYSANINFVGIKYPNARTLSGFGGTYNVLSGACLAYFEASNCYKANYLAPLLNQQKLFKKVERLFVVK